MPLAVQNSEYAQAVQSRPPLALPGSLNTMTKLRQEDVLLGGRIVRFLRQPATIGTGGERKGTRKQAVGHSCAEALGFIPFFYHYVFSSPHSCRRGGK